MKIQKLLQAALLAATTLTSGAVLAHGDAVAKHGGMVAVSQDLAFELVQGESGISIYIDDHGQTLSVEGMSGKLTILSAGEKSEYELLPHGDHLKAGGVTLASGARAVAAIKTGAQSAVTVRFAIK